MARFYDYNHRDYSMPHEQEIGYIEPGSIIYIHCKVEGDAQSNSTINLQTGPGTDFSSDVALHFSPRFERGLIARNTWSDRQWGPEDTYGGMPISRGHDFEMVILAHESHFKVAINGTHFCDYNHRLPLTAISHITLTGDYHIKSVQVHKGQGIAPVPAEYGLIQPAHEPPMPHTANIDGWLIPNRNLWIRATPHHGCQRIAFSLKSGDNDYVLTFEIRFDSNVVVLNSSQGGTWGEEKRPDAFPFRHGATFDLLFKVEDDEFKIYVDGKKLKEYDHRLPLSSVDVLQLAGNVDVHHYALQ